MHSSVTIDVELEHASNSFFFKKKHAGNSVQTFGLPSGLRRPVAADGPTKDSNQTTRTGPLEGHKPIMSHSATPTRRHHRPLPTKNWSFSCSLVRLDPHCRALFRSARAHGAGAAARAIAGRKTVRRRQRTTILCIRLPKVFRGS